MDYGYFPKALPYKIDNLKCCWRHKLLQELVCDTRKVSLACQDILYE
jgi:hypothetical protein